jgi:hypothetical protein
MPVSNYSTEQREQFLPAEQQIGRMIRRQAKPQRRIPEIPLSIQQYSRERCIQIYNVGPWQHIESKGSWGIFVIPACPEGQPFVRMLPSSPGCPGVPGTWHEFMIEDDKNMKYEQQDGLFVAEQIVGVGGHMQAGDSLIFKGVFIGSERGPDAMPTASELKAANVALDEYCDYLIQEAETAWVERRPKDISKDTHHLAAKRRGRMDLQWIRFDQPQAKRECPVCGKLSAIGIIRCECSYKFDPAAWDQLVLDGRVSDPVRLAELKAVTEPQEEKKAKRSQPGS